MFSSSLWFTDICANDCACVCAKLLQSHVTLCDPMDCRPPGSSVHGALQARILEWVAMPSSRGSSQPGVRTCISYVSCIGRWVLCHLYHLGSPWVQLKMQGSSCKSSVLRSTSEEYQAPKSAWLGLRPLGEDIWILSFLPNPEGYYTEAKFTTLKCLFGVWITLRWKQSRPQNSGRNSDLPPTD